MGLRDAVLEAGMRRGFRRRVERLDLATQAGDTRVVSESEIALLPSPAQRYLRFMGVVGKPREWSFQCHVVGSFRLQPTQQWMPFHARQYTTSAGVARIFYMRVALAGLIPMSAEDTYVAGRGRLIATVLGAFRVAHGTGHEFDVSELVTYVNDAFLMAPSMLLTDAVRWVPVDDESFEVVVIDAATSVTARVFIDAAGRLVNFCTNHRYAALPGGLVQTRWSTPVAGWAEYQGRWLPTRVDAIWHLADGDFCYVRAQVVPQSVEFDVPAKSRLP